MEYVKLGRTGLEVSRICLGCMSYGVPDRGNHAWSLDEEESRPFIKRALEGGINFFDTANRYSLGSSEEILGRAIKDFARRDEVVIATKVYGRMRPGPNGGGLSRKAIMARSTPACGGSAPITSISIRSIAGITTRRSRRRSRRCTTSSRPGKARYIGASSMHAWQFARALGIAERHGWTRFVSMQNLVNLLYREEEREMLPLCAAEGIGVIPWSPQARGRLTRDWDYTSIRTETDDAFDQALRQRPRRPTGRWSIASPRSPRRAAFHGRRWRWPGCCRSRSSPRRSSAPPSCSISTTLSHPCNVKLSADEIASLEAPYVPHAVVGFT